MTSQRKARVSAQPRKERQSRRRLGGAPDTSASLILLWDARASFLSGSRRSVTLPKISERKEKMTASCYLMMTTSPLEKQSASHCLRLARPDRRFFTPFTVALFQRRI